MCINPDQGSGNPWMPEPRALDMMLERSLHPSGHRTVLSLSIGQFARSLGVSWMKSETELETSDRGQVSPGWKMAVLISKGNCPTRLVLGNRKKVDLYTHPPNPKSLWRSLNWIQSRIQCRCFQHHISVFRLCPWSHLWEQEKQSKPTFQE